MTYERINPEELGAPRGFTNGMLGPSGGRVLFVAGQDAANPDGVVTTDDFVQQFDIALRKTLTVVTAAGGAAKDVGRLTIFVTDLDAYRAMRPAVGEAYRSHMGHHFPAMALMEVSRLVDPRGRVEIEATAIIPDSPAESAPDSSA